MIDTPPLLLDTHVWIWLINGNSEQLSPDVIAGIEPAAMFAKVYLKAP